MDVENTLFSRRVPASFRPELLQAGVVKGLMCVIRFILRRISIIHILNECGCGSNLACALLCESFVHVDFVCLLFMCGTHVFLSVE